jgi:hypothetical protein
LPLEGNAMVWALDEESLESLEISCEVHLGLGSMS